MYNLTLESSADRLTAALTTLKLESNCPSIEAEGCALCAPLTTYHQGNNLKSIHGAQSVLMFLDSPISLSLFLMRLPPHTSFHQHYCGSQPTQHSTRGILTPPSCSKRCQKRSRLSFPSETVRQRTPCLSIPLPTAQSKGGS